MPRTDDDVLNLLREIRAAGPMPAPSRIQNERTLAAVASLEGKSPRRTDGEVARAVMALEIAFSSPSFEAVMGGLGQSTGSKRGRTKVVAAAATVDSDSSFCKIYGEVKDYIDITVEALDWMPIPYATIIAKVVRLLEKFADRACRP